MYKIILGLFFIFISMANSLADEIEPTEFKPENLACYDKSSDELHKKVDTILDNPESDLYWIAHQRQIIPVMREFANQGSYYGMFEFGSFYYEAIALNYHYQYENADDTEKKLHHTDKNYPDRVIMPYVAKPYITEAITYIYISSTKDFKKKNDAIKFFKDIELDKRGMVVPKLWIIEAKENANKWKAYCESIKK